MSIRIPPGGRVELEVTVDEHGNVMGTRQVGETQPIGETTGATMQDPVGGPPLVVSSRLRPDPMAMYLLATAIIDATRAVDQHTEAVERNREAADAAAAKSHALLERQEKRDRLFRPVMLVCAGLGISVLLLDLAVFLSQHVHLS